MLRLLAFVILLVAAIAAESSYCPFSEGPEVSTCASCVVNDGQQRS